MKKQLLKILKLLPTKQKRSLIILGLILFLGMVFEILGLSILIPALNFILNPQEINNLKNNLSFYDFSSFSYKDFIWFGMSIISLIYFTKSIVLVIITFHQYNIVEKLSSFLSIKLFKKYIYQPYEYHTKRDLSEIIKNLQIEINHFTVICRSILVLLIELILSLSILATIYYIEPFGAFVVSVFFGTLAFIYFLITKKGIKIWGIARQNIDKILSKTVIDSLSGIKDVKLLSKENFFLNKYILKIEERIKISTYRQTVTHSSRYYLELITVFGIIIFIIFMMNLNSSSTEIITTLGIFVAATFRIIPSINKVLASLQNIKYYSPSVDIIFDEFDKTIDNRKSIENKKELFFSEKLEIKELNFNYDRKNILNDINLEIKKGETIGIIGSSGSGKTTLIDIINGLLKPSSGNFYLDNVCINKFKNSLMDIIGYVGQEIFLIDDSIVANIAFGIEANQIDTKALNHAIDSSELSDLIKELPEGINSTVGERGIQLSGGQRQRIGIARALYRNPQILIFDEATASLDNKTEKAVIKSINNLSGDKTIIMIAHRLSTLSNCDRILEIKKGKIKEVKLKF